jgi:hypothetical protein
MGRCLGGKQGFENPHLVDVDTESETVVLQKVNVLIKKLTKEKKRSLTFFWSGRYGFNSCFCAND